MINYGLFNLWRGYIYYSKSNVKACLVYIFYMFYKNIAYIIMVMYMYIYARQTASFIGT